MPPTTGDPSASLRTGYGHPASVAGLVTADGVLGFPTLATKTTTSRGWGTRLLWPGNDDRSLRGKRVGGAEGEAVSDGGELVSAADSVCAEARREDAAHGGDEGAAASEEDAIDILC